MSSIRTYFHEYLPKDLIEYHLKQYTGPVDMWYVKKRDGGYYVGNDYQHLYKRRYGYIGKNMEEMTSIANRFGGNLYSCKAIFLDGKAYRLYEIPKLHGMPKDVVPKKKSLRCEGKTKANKRCRNKTKHSTRLCPIHREP